MTDWSSLRDAYGPATEIPRLLSEAAGVRAVDAPVWDELWGRLCHQGTVASASYAALPALTAMAEGYPPSSYVPPLFLAAGIIASNDPPDGVQDARRRYRGEISVLRDIAERNLSASGQFRDFVYSLQTLAAFENLGVWQRELDSLSDEELQLGCTDCGEHLYLNLEPTRFTAATDDVSRPATRITRARETDLTGLHARLVSLARRHGQDAVVIGLLHLFGKVECPSCRAVFWIERALE